MSYKSTMASHYFHQVGTSNSFLNMVLRNDHKPNTKRLYKCKAFTNFDNFFPVKPCILFKHSFSVICWSGAQSLLASGLQVFPAIKLNNDHFFIFMFFGWTWAKSCIFPFLPTHPTHDRPPWLYLQKVPTFGLIRFCQKFRFLGLLNRWRWSDLFDDW